jgi:hypothetical protein
MTHGQLLHFADEQFHVDQRKLMNVALGIYGVEHGLALENHPSQLWVAVAGVVRRNKLRPLIARLLCRNQLAVHLLDGLGKSVEHIIAWRFRFPSAFPCRHR